jgi:hypothetical protein
MKKKKRKKWKEEAFVCTHVKINNSPLNPNVMYDRYNPNDMYCIHTRKEHSIIYLNVSQTVVKFYIIV